MSDTRMHGEFLRTRVLDPMALLDHDPANPCPPLTAKDYDALRQSIEEHGFLDAWPVVVSAGPACEGQIIDGFHRTKVAAELGIDAPVVGVPCADEAEFLVLQVRANLARRQLSDVDRWRLGQKLAEAYGLRAADRMKSGRGEPSGQLAAGSEKGDTRDLLAAEVGLSGKTFERIDKVMRSDNDFLKQELEEQRISAYKAATLLRAPEAQAALDTAVETEAEAAREIEETYFTSEGDKAETRHDERERAVGTAVRLAMELDALIRHHGLMDQDILELRARPHTATGTFRRLADWLDLTASALELNR